MLTVLLGVTGPGPLGVPVTPEVAAPVGVVGAVLPQVAGAVTEMVFDVVLPEAFLAVTE